jgi:hypothetical protein
MGISGRKKYGPIFWKKKILKTHAEIFLAVCGPAVRIAENPDLSRDFYLYLSF